MTKALAKRVEPAAMPVAYTRAVAALTECRSLDDAKTFTDSAEALAVWARIYKHNDAGRQAKQLRLHAHRRMGHLARELSVPKGKPGGGSEPGPIALLKAHGLSRHQADAANHLAKIAADEFDTFVTQDVPPAPTTVVRRYRRGRSLTPWNLLRERPRTPFACSGYIENNDPSEIAKKMSGDEVQIAQKIALDLVQWLQAFTRALPRY